MAVQLLEKNTKKSGVFLTTETILVFQQLYLIPLKNLCGQEINR